jgi:hypothetical protein
MEEKILALPLLPLAVVTKRGRLLISYSRQGAVGILHRFPCAEDNPITFPLSSQLKAPAYFLLQCARDYVDDLRMAVELPPAMAFMKTCNLLEIIRRSAATTQPKGQYRHRESEAHPQRGVSVAHGMEVSFRADRRS